MKTTLALAALITAFSAPMAFAAGDCGTGPNTDQTATGATCATLSGGDTRSYQGGHHDDEDSDDDSGHNNDRGRDNDR